MVEIVTIGGIGFLFVMAALEIALTWISIRGDGQIPQAVRSDDSNEAFDHRCVFRSFDETVHIWNTHRHASNVFLKRR